MSEDWNAIAAEVGDAIRSIGQDTGGYPITLRIPGAVTGPSYDPTFGDPTYLQLHGVEDYQRIKDQAGTLIGQTMHTLMVTADGGTVPLKSHKIALGVLVADASESSAWVEIAEVRPLSPAGIAVLYELDLVS